MTLLANGAPAKDMDDNPVGPVTLSESKTSHSFTNLPKWEGTTLISYTVEESGLSTGYSLASIAKDGRYKFSVTNKATTPEEPPETPDNPPDTPDKPDKPGRPTIPFYPNIPELPPLIRIPRAGV